jgi:hypothetical protein
MAITKRLLGVLTFVLAGALLGTTATGCDKLKGGDDETTEEEDDKDKKEETKEEEPAPSATTSSSAGEVEEGEVETYPEMTKAGGTFRLLRSFNVYQAADESSKKLSGLARNTLVDFKFFYKDWIMVEWPSGPAELSPGWMHLRSQDRARDTKAEEKKEEPDAGKPVEVPDAGVAVTPDAGKPPEPATPDAGSGKPPRFRFRIPRVTRPPPIQPAPK